MARGIDPKEAVPYVLEADEELPEKEQTVFYIKPKDAAAANRSTARYIETLKEKGDGKRALDVKASNMADVKEFLDIVEKVENFAFSDGYYQDHPDMLERAKEVDTLSGEKIPYVPVLEDDYDLADVARNLSNSYLREIFNAADDISKLKGTTKKG